MLLNSLIIQIFKCHCQRVSIRKKKKKKKKTTGFAHFEVPMDRKCHWEEFRGAFYTHPKISFELFIFDMAMAAPAFEGVKFEMLFI